jgi:hypothetical protein
LFAIGCAPTEKDADLDPAIDAADSSERDPNGPDPGEFESCRASWVLAESAPMGSAVDPAAGPSIFGRFTDAPNFTETEFCGSEFEVLLAVDANPDPAVSDWHHLPASVEWTWEGDRSWQVDIEPDWELSADALYAVEVVLRMEGELPLGMIWTWQTGGEA